MHLYPLSCSPLWSPLPSGQRGSVRQQSHVGLTGLRHRLRLQHLHLSGDQTVHYARRSAAGHGHLPLGGVPRAQTPNAARHRGGLSVSKQRPRQNNGWQGSNLQHANVETDVPVPDNLPMLSVKWKLFRELTQNLYIISYRLGQGQTHSPSLDSSVFSSCVTKGQIL